MICAHMEPTRCLVCGTRHWSRQPCPVGKSEKKLAKAVTINSLLVRINQLPVTENATSNTPTPVTRDKPKRGRPKIGKALSPAERMPDIAPSRNPNDLHNRQRKHRWPLTSSFPLLNLTSIGKLWLKEPGSIAAAFPSAS